MQVTTIGLDLAKHVFQVPGVDATGTIVVKRRLRRSQMTSFFAGLAPCTVGMEACATAHFWARELQTLGHDVRLMPAQYVKAYIKRGKNDAADAAATCEAVSRPSMRFVPVKSEAQQAALMLHRARDLLMRQRTQLINAVRGHLAEFGIILASAAGVPAAEVARRAGVGRPAVWRWQRRFAEAGVDGLLREATCKPGKAPLAGATVRWVVALTCAEPPGAATHWTGRAMARAAGISLRSVQRIWQAHRLQPHRIRTFKRSTDPAFAAKLEDIVGLYVDPPKHALVLSVDEKPQIQALDRTQPGLPIKPGKAGTTTHDYVRNGTTTLFAALDGTVLGRCMQRHRHQEFLRFLNTIERAVPAGKVIHAIMDNYGSHKHPTVLRWLTRHPRWVFHFTPTSGSWLNAVETFFSALTRRRLKRGSFHSVVDLQAAINRYIAEHNHDPKPFTWTKTSDEILAKVHPLNAPMH